VTAGTADSADPAQPGHRPPPLAGLRVVELATLFAGPLAATWLGDFGADVVKVEHPRRPDPSRGHGPDKDGIGLWWKTIGRNKRTATLDLSAPHGRDLILRLAADADVVIENFRPGTLERWGLGPDRLAEANPGLILARVTAFGQHGPYAARPGFGTLAEAMSGFAALTGEPEGPPILPPFALADGVASLAVAYAVMLALASRAGTGRGQVVDLAIIEPLLALLGPQISAFDQLGQVQERTGNLSSSNAPRNLYRTGDGSWVAVSASAQNIAERVMRLVGRPDLIDEPWFASGTGRALHVDEIDPPVAAWIARHTLEQTLAAFEQAEAAVGPVYDVRGILADPQYQALDTAVTVDDPDLGPLRMQNLMFRLTGSPGAIRWTGRAHGADTAAVLGEIGVDAAQLAALRALGAV
jgi:crotonobetainyl-CoA:carnitine CoA-transferase CaiB-like acyl-CoA transferase